MNFSHLTHTNAKFFLRYYKLIAIAALITIAVIVGSLVTGDSVRTTLVKRVTERLGDTETVIFARNSFMAEELADDAIFDNGRGILLTNGFIAQSGRLIPVYVWGVDDLSIPKGTARINPALQKELGESNPGAIILRLPATGMVPSGSLFVTENYTTSLRLTFDGIIDVEAGGNISMKNEQVIPLNIFVDRTELAETLETPGKINLILTRNEISEDDLNQVWRYPASGLSVARKEGFTEITSDRVFLQEKVVETIAQNNHEPNRLFSYLVNSMELGKTAIPYSFVTALDSYNDNILQKDEIILSDYSAQRLQAQPGDSISISFFTSQDLKTLKTETLTLRVKAIVPLQDLLEDKTLSADFPGLSNVDRCTDWDSDLPINMDLITDEDEDYWERYRNTPKALIAYDAVAKDWGNAYGTATAIRVDNPVPDLTALQAEMFGIQVIHPREAGLYAAGNGVDFSGLFLALGFFIILSAMLLLLIPLSEMLYQRREEIALMQELGFTKRRIGLMLRREAVPIILLSSAAGVVAGLLYTTLILWLLGNVWKGATHTDGFAPYPSSDAIIFGLAIGMIIAMLLLWYAIRRHLKEKQAKQTKKRQTLAGKKILVVLASLLTIGIICVNLFYLHSVILFVLIGIILLATAAIWGDYLICRNGRATSGDFSANKLVWSTLFANKRQAILSFFALAIGVFIVFSVGLNRQSFADSSQLRTGTGGYSLWCESTVPIYHNLETQAGKEKLSLTTLPADVEILQCLRYGADDASCLNLNKVVTPTVLGVDMDALASSDFQIEQNIYSLDRDDVFQRVKTADNNVYPALVDATVLTWSLMMSLGDTLRYTDDRGQEVAILLAGTLSNSIFQGNILIDRSLFTEIWEETAGSEVFLLKTAETEREEVKTLLSQALNEYGVRVTTTNERLKQFNSVTDTYLTIFLTLGGIGLLLGIFSFIIVIRKNLSTRRREIDLYRTLGFTDRKIEQILFRENLLVPIYAIVVGVVCAFVGISLNFMNTSVWIWLLALLFIAFFIVCTVAFVRRSVTTVVRDAAHYNF